MSWPANAGHPGDPASLARIVRGSTGWPTLRWAMTNKERDSRRAMGREEPRPVSFPDMEPLTEESLARHEACTVPEPKLDLFISIYLAHVPCRIIGNPSVFD